jgi:uncharacterized protein (DUF302 family)
VESLALELKRRGFGVLSNIDVKKIIKEKLGEEMRKYVILDVCSPTHAKKAIDAHKMIGLVLPCKIVVFEDEEAESRGGGAVISLYRPTQAIKVTGEFGDLEPLAREVERQLVEAIDAASAAVG